MNKDFVVIIFFILLCSAVRKGVLGITNPIDFFNECGTEKTCFGLTEGCEKAKNCEFAISARKISDTDGYKFELLGTQTPEIKYVALGISQDATMGADGVIECFEDKSGNLRVHLSKNEGYSNEQLVVQPNITSQQSKKIDARFMCEVILPGKIAFDSVEIDFKNKYYLLIAVGGVMNSNQIDYHSKKAATGTALEISAVHSELKIDKNNHTLAKAHGGLMVFVYFVFMPIGTILARFYKETWASITIYKKRLWFRLHTGCMIFGLCLAIVSINLIIIDVQGWVLTNNGVTHAIIGIVSLAILLIQTTVSWFKPNDPLLRKIFYIAHLLAGLTCYILGLTNIALSPSMVPHVAFCAGTKLVVAWGLCHILMYMWMTVNLLCNDRYYRNDENDSPGCRAITAYPMKMFVMEEAPGTTVRRISLVIFVLIAVGLASTFSVMMAKCDPCS